MGTSTGRASGFASRAFVAAAFVVVLLVPNVCDAASALKVAENKLREKGLLHDVESSGARHVEDVSIDFGVDDPPVSSAEGKFRAAREILEGHEYTGSRRKTHAVRTLKEVLAAEPEHREAMTLLGRAFQTGDGADQDDARSLELFKRAAALGDPGAHNELGFAYSVGWAGTPQSTAKSVLHQYFASMGGDSLAQMALGHRHLFGLGVPKSCQSAALFYDPPASRVSDLIAASIGPSTGSAFEKTRLSTETEGQREDSLVKREVQVAQYYQYSADMGNADAASAVGRLLNAGARGVKADRKAAYKYFTQAAAAGDADALAHLGHMWANGIGVSPNNKTALALFHKAAEKGNARAIYGLGYMYLSGYGVARDVGKAVDFFTNAAEQGFADAQFHLGALYARGVVPVGDKKDHTNKGKGDAKGDTKGDKNTQAQKKDHAKAFYNFNLAAAQGHAVATYNLAMMQLSGSLGLPQTCNAATLLLKGLAERGEWTRSIEEARVNVASVKRKKTGLLRYMKLAEAGIEVAQANAAFILDRSERWYDDEMEEDVPISGVVPTTVGTPSREHRALHYHRLAADQGNVFSLLKIGDAYFYGKGVNDRMSKQSEGDLTSLKPSIELSRQNKNTSAAVYLQASQHRSAQAMFNLGLMHEHGVGLPKDLHLAKRYYDMALSTDPKAFVPVKLALWKLKMHTWLELKARESALVGKGVKWLHRVMGVVFLSDVGFEEDLETDNETDYSHETNNLSNEQKKNGSSKDFDTVALKVLAALLGAVVLARFGVGLGFAAPRGGAEAETAVETNREITGVETTTAETTGEETTAIDTVADPLDPDPTTS